MSLIAPLAPSGNNVVAYDQTHLSLYAALIDADDAGEDWRATAMSLMQLDLADNSAEACWRSHLERARWMIGAGLANALVAFGAPKSPITAD
jgi:hypothetical protein